jgi:hypothetical protein
LSGWASPALEPTGRRVSPLEEESLQQVENMLHPDVMETCSAYPHGVEFEPLRAQTHKTEMFRKQVHWNLGKPNLGCMDKHGPCLQKRNLALRITGAKCKNHLDYEIN